MSPARYTFRPILRGDTGALSFYLRRVEIVTQQRLYLDLTDHAVELTLRASGKPDVVYNRNAGLIVEDRTGSISCPLSAAVTLWFPAGNSDYRLRITDTDGRVTTVLTGTITLLDWPMSTPFPMRAASPVESAVGLDAPFEVVEVVVPYNEGTVAEAIRQAKEVVSQITIDQIDGLRDQISQDIAKGLISADAASVVNALVFG